MSNAIGLKIWSNAAYGVKFEVSFHFSRPWEAWRGHQSLALQPHPASQHRDRQHSHPGSVSRHRPTPDQLIGLLRKRAWMGTRTLSYRSRSSPVASARFIAGRSCARTDSVAREKPLIDPSYRWQSAKIFRVIVLERPWSESQDVVQADETRLQMWKEERHWSEYP